MKRVLLVPLAALFIFTPAAHGSVPLGGETLPPVYCNEIGPACEPSPDLCFVTVDSDGNTPPEECIYPEPPYGCFDDGTTTSPPPDAGAPGPQGGDEATAPPSEEEVCSCYGWSEPGYSGDEDWAESPKVVGESAAISESIDFDAPENPDWGCTYEECYGGPECVYALSSPGQAEDAAKRAKQKRVKARKAAKAKRARIKAKKRKARLEAKRAAARND